MKKTGFMVSCLLLLCGCHDRKEGGVEPSVRQLEVAFADASEVEFAPGEQRSIPFTVRSTEFAGLEFAAAAAGGDASQWKLSVEQGKAEAASMPCVLKAQAPEKEVKTRLTVTVTAPEGLRREASIAVRVVEPAVPDPEPEPDPGPAAEELSAAGRANCYIISAAGRYMFDATVCGNGSGDGASIALTDDMRADWLWATTGVEATLGEVRLDAARGRIYLTVEPFVAGNALVVLTDAQGAILWSWHLWFTEQPATVTYANGRVMQDRNLGATSATPGETTAYGLYYQWGRKEPFCGGVTTESSAESMAQARAGTTVNPAFAEAHAWQQASGAEFSTLEYAAAHPMTFLSNKGTTGTYDWLASPRDDLWGTQKSIYDPCPPGYRVPDRDTWDDFADEADRYIEGVSTWDGTLYGMTYTHEETKDWYPAQGYRNRDQGNLVGLATTRTGHYWSNYRSGRTISHFYISKRLSTGKLLQPQSTDKSDAAYGYNVRCQRE